jgi:hypothetical protein
MRPGRAAAIFCGLTGRRGSGSIVGEGDILVLRLSLILNPIKELNMKSTKSAAKLAAPKPVQKTTQTTQPAPQPQKAAVPASVTTIDVKLDVGFGNAVYLRGQGAGLSWEQGVPLACVDSRTWRWSGEAKDSVTFKLLINDKIWSAGNDLTVNPGQKIEIAPAFV